MASGLPDPTAALETYVAAGGCPLSDLLGLLSRAVRSTYFHTTAAFNSPGDIASYGT